MEDHTSGRNIVVMRMENCDHGFDKNKKHKIHIEAVQEAYAEVANHLNGLQK